MLFIICDPDLVQSIFSVKQVDILISKNQALQILAKP